MVQEYEVYYLHEEVIIGSSLLYIHRRSYIVAHY